MTDTERTLAAMRAERATKAVISLGTEADGFAPDFGFDGGLRLPFEIYGKQTQVGGPLRHPHPCFCGSTEGKMWGVLGPEQGKASEWFTHGEALEQLSGGGPKWVRCEACISVGAVNYFYDCTKRFKAPVSNLGQLGTFQAMECSRLSIDQIPTRRISANHVVLMGRIHVLRSIKFATWDTKAPSETVRYARCVKKLHKNIQRLAGKIIKSIPNEALK